MKEELLSQDECESLAKEGYELHLEISKVCDGHPLFVVMQACCAMLGKSIAHAVSQAIDKKSMEKTCTDFVAKNVPSFYKNALGFYSEDRLEK